MILSCFLLELICFINMCLKTKPIELRNISNCVAVCVSICLHACVYVCACICMHASVSVTGFWMFSMFNMFACARVWADIHMCELHKCNFVTAWTFAGSVPSTLTVTEDMVRTHVFSCLLYVCTMLWSRCVAFSFPKTKPNGFFHSQYSFSADVYLKTTGEGVTEVERLEGVQTNTCTNFVNYLPRCVKYRSVLYILNGLWRIYK